MLRSLLPCLMIVATLLAAPMHAQEKHVTLNSRDLKPGERIDGTSVQSKSHPFKDGASNAAWKRTMIKQEGMARPIAAQPEVQGHMKGGGLGSCDCWVEPNSTYTLIDNETEWEGPIPGDDASYGPIQLPFGFYLYGQTYTEAYININGNVSFGGPNSVYTATGFPDPDNVMVAPFWADVYVNDGPPGFNEVKFRVTPTALYVNWVRVGYYLAHTDLTNTFQLIITDGSDPAIPNGANVSFCYKDMQWTTGDASEGEGGFNGTPANVGANRGDGVNYLQFGRFDHEGTDYNGPFGSPGGVSWLDNQYFTFMTDVTTGNVPPVLSGASVCNYLPVCTYQPVNLEVSFLSPEPDQITVATSTAPGFPDYTIVSNTSGQTAAISTTFTPTTPGMYQVTFEGSDNGTPALSSSLTINVEVFESPSGFPVINGELTACDGQGTILSVQGGDFTDYHWSNGYQGAQVLVGPGVYTVSAGEGVCLLTSDPITVTAAPSPSPVIDGVLFNCGGDPAVLSTTEPYAAYSWSTGAQTPTVSVGTGSYYVTVTNDGGCQGTSPAVQVNTASSPSASFTSQPNGLLLIGTTVDFTNTTQSNGTNITGIVWQIGDLMTSSDPNITYTFDEPGTYAVTLTVTTSDGCTSVYTLYQTIVPAEIIVPNVFTPNGDAYNQTLEFAGAEFYPNTRLNVFNRWGQEVFTSTNYKNTWQGTDMPEGTYFYVLKLENGKDYTGQVTLLR